MKKPCKKEVKIPAIDRGAAIDSGLCSSSTADGVAKESWSFADAARRVADEQKGIATKTKSEKEVKPEAYFSPRIVLA